jgi:hypothetical protein
MMVIGLAGCASGAAAGPAAGGGTSGAASNTSGAAPTDPPRTSSEVAAALARAQAAFVAGDWGKAVVEANRVMEGAAAADEYYAAVQVLGLASCARRDPRPVAFAWKRLLPVDRVVLKESCAARGITISDEGRVDVAP